MSDDHEAIWRVLADRAVRDADQRRADRGDPAATAGRQLRHESKVRILTATINVVGAVRELLEVTEGALTEHRDHLARQTETDLDGTTPTGEPQPRATRKIKLEY